MNRTSGQTPAKSRKDSYKQTYDSAKKGGEQFFPETISRDAIVALLIVAAIFVLATVLPATTQPPADPTSTNYNPRPEWYFLFFFQFLKLFPGYLEPVAAAIVPAVALILLILFPLLDKNPDRRIMNRKAMLALGGAMIAVFIALEVGGALSAPGVPAGQESQQVQSGRLVYKQFNCAYCHAINGVGGAVGPDLSQTGAKWKLADLSAYLTNPNSMIPKTLHPKLLFTSDELGNLSAYLLTLGAPVPFSAQAPQLFTQNCGGCHILNGQGGNVGPDLSGVGSRRDFNFLEAFTTDPASVIPGASMPAFKKKLSAAEIADIAAYLYSQK